MSVLVDHHGENAQRMLCQELQLEVSALFNATPCTVGPGCLVTKVDTDLGAMLGYLIACFRPATQTLQPRDALERGVHCGSMGDRILLSRSLWAMGTDIMLHLVFTYSLQELLPDLNNSWAPASRQAELQFYLALA